MGSSDKKKDCWRYFESKGILWKWKWRNPTNEDELLLSHVYSDLNVDPELQMTVQEFVNIDKDLLTSQDVSDVNIIESIISDTSEGSQTDDDDDIEEVQPTCK